ncbi:hypothetical protein HY642_01000 [Candidatus Woesearchaeota archaeon]|nr:hypothetical protein [Candidatus Woesearchaeota archaeon]
MEIAGEDMLEDLCGKVKQDYDAVHSVISFSEYLQLAANNPLRHLRMAHQYVLDAIRHFGVETVTDCGREFLRYKLFDDPFDNGQNKVVGQLRPIAELMKQVETMATGQGKERMIVLYGPPGTAKSRITELIMRGLEEYSKLPEGTAYTIQWRFKADEELGEEKRGMGFREQDFTAKDEHLAELPLDKRLLPPWECQLRDHPLLLIPPKHREEYMRKILAERHEHLLENRVDIYGGELLALEKFSVPAALKEGELCRNCQRISDRLLDIYKGDWNRALNHVAVKRFTYSLADGRGLAEVNPDIRVETALEPVARQEGQSAASRLSSLLDGIQLYNFEGKQASANRGVISYQDIYNRPLSMLLHLLTAIEETRVNFGDISQRINAAYFGNSNLAELHAMRRELGSDGLKARTESIPALYLLNYQDEARVYDEIVAEINKRQHVSPHVVEMAAIYAVLTRLVKPNMDAYLEHENSRIARDDRQRADYNAARTFAASMTPLCKAKLYAGQMDDFKPDERRVLSNSFLAALRSNEIEGMWGMDPRTIQNILAKLSNEGGECINVFRLYDQISETIKRRGKDFRLRPEWVGATRENPNPDGVDFKKLLGDKWGDLEQLLLEVKGEFQRIVVAEVEEALFGITQDDIVSRVRKYVGYCKSYGKQEKVFEHEFKKAEVDAKVMLEREEKFLGITGDEQREKYRQAVLAAYMKVQSEHPDINGDPMHVIPTVVQAYRRALYSHRVPPTEVKSFVAKLLTNLAKVREGAQAKDELERHGMAEAVKAIEILKSKHGYCDKCAPPLIKYVFTDPTMLVKVFPEYDKK